MMTKDTSVEKFVKDLTKISALRISKKWQGLVVPDFPFDSRLLGLSRLYRESRKLYLGLGGRFSPRLCSTMRSLSAQDLFRDEIDYSPTESELLWLKDHTHEVEDPRAHLRALFQFNEISIFHEQNHRVLWRLLPPVPAKQDEVRRYLNFAESLVVALDLALGDELGKNESLMFERMKVVYRPAGADQWFKKSKGDEYCRYLLASVFATYLLLERAHEDDILNAVNYAFPAQVKINRDAVTRALELSESFTETTNPEWQKRYWKEAQQKLRKIQRGSPEATLTISPDPLDMEKEFEVALRVFSYFGL